MLSARQQHCLQGMGIRLWQERSKDPLPIENTPQATPATERRPAPPLEELLGMATTKPATEIDQPRQEAEGRHKHKSFTLDNWEQLHQAIEACHNCPLGDSCTHKVPGKGNHQASLMIIGEAPGAQEDRQGIPFVGRAGQLLDQMLKAIDLKTEEVYITNILKCRPPNNRDPLPTEVAACQPFLQAQIRLLQPRVILSVGRISAQNLLGVKTTLGQLRQQQHQLPGSDIPLVVTYHPAYLLRNPIEKYKVWSDLRALLKLLVEKKRHLPRNTNGAKIKHTP